MSNPAGTGSQLRIAGLGEQLLKQSGEFSLRALYAALDAQRQLRGISWAEATKEMNGHSGPRSGHALSASTVTGTRTRKVAEGDGILQMLRWLKQSPEGFVPGYEEAEQVNTRLPHVPPNRVLRFDTKKLYAALDAQRTEKKMTWAQVAKEVGLATRSLTYLS